jgi:pimeloyl-ACP methyl ester carboxylesterase
MTTYVLVHGAWHGGWCWKRVVPLLRAKGHTVFAPSLTGLAERSHLLNRDTGLYTHIDDVVNLLRWEELHDVVLVGHSYGGMVISGVAEREHARIRSLVYLDAMLPADGQSSFDIMAPARREMVLESANKVGEGWKVTPITAEQFCMKDPVDAAWVNRQCTMHPLKALQEPVRLSGNHLRVSNLIYILAGDYRPSQFAAIHERLRTDPAWRTHSVPSGHDVMVERPHELAAILLGA